MEVIAEQIAEMAAKANAWLNFSIACAWIGFGLSVIALAYLLIGQYIIIHKPKHERRRRGYEMSHMR